MAALQPIAITLNLYPNRRDVEYLVDLIALACPGRIEGRSDVVNVGAAIDGLVRAVYVKEGQSVPQGDILAELHCSDLQPRWPIATV
jgi:multidrug efflux pump subunit AcrA (membrane-fusion protein)